MQEQDKYQLMFLLLQSALLGTPAPDKIEIPPDADWAAVLKEMQAQSVDSLLEPILDGLPISDPEIRETWRMRCMRQQAKWYRLAAAQQALVELLEENGIPCVILKGMAAAQYYPKPECRAAGDVDFLVKREDFEPASKLLEKSGYTLACDVDYAPHHKEFVRDGVTFELHRWIGDDEDDREPLRSLLQLGVEARKPVTVNDISFPAYAPAQNGLVLLQHMKHHIREGLQLRQVLDWMLYVEIDLTDAVWRELLPTLEELGLTTFAAAMTALCRQYLGLRRELPDCEPIEPELCEQLMALILRSGAFSVASALDGHIATAFQSVRGPISLFRRLQKGGCSRWTAAKKHKILRPFAWAYQAGYILKQIVPGKKTIGSIHRLQAVGDQQKTLLQKLEIEVQ